MSHQQQGDTSIPPLASSNVIKPSSQASKETQEAIGVKSGPVDKIKDFFSGKNSADRSGSGQVVHHDSPIKATGQRKDETVEQVPFGTASGDPAEKIGDTGVIHNQNRPQ